MNRDQLLKASRIVRRIHARFVWESSAALHVGSGGESNAADMALLRAADGSFYIPASSIAGACRSALAAYYQDYSSFRDGNEPAEVKLLFGAHPRGTDGKKAEHYASLLTVMDAPLVSGPGITVRDGVRIEPDTGIAADSAKFNLEVLPKGSRFRMEFSLAMYHELPWDLDPDSLVACFHTMLDLLRDGRIRLGARTRRGFGEGRALDIKVFELDMNAPKHLAAWLRRKPELGTGLDRVAAPMAPNHPVFSIDAELRLKTSLLIRSTSAKPEDPDAVHLTENGSCVLPGTSLGGAVRHRCLRIASTLNLERRKEIIDSMFGPEATTPGEKGEGLRGGRIWFSESALSNGSRHVQGRVAIDRFTGGALESALFDEAPFWPEGDGPHVRVTIRLDDPRPPEAALLLLAFKDLWLGDLQLGGGAGVGRGVFQGISATITQNGRGTVQMQAEPGSPARLRSISGETAWINDCVRNLNNAAGQWQPPEYDLEAKEEGGEDEH